MKDDKLWTAFSRYIRLKKSDNNGFCTCITCHKVFFWKEIQAGHFVSRKHNATKYDEDNVWPQCVHCNIFLHGDQFNMGKMIDKKLGEGSADKLVIRSKMTFRLTNIPELTSHYNLEIQRLLKEKNL